MRVPVTLAWIIMVLFVFTAGLLRRFHDRIPESPYLHPLVGNLLFAGIFVLLLVASETTPTRAAAFSSPTFG